MMDEAFSLRLQASIAPASIRWPTKIEHWDRMHAAVQTARSGVSRALAAMDRVDQDTHLTPEGKQSARAQVAAEALADFEKSAALTNAQTAVARQLQRWAAKIDDVVKVPADAHGVALHAQIRDRVVHMTREERLTFFQKHSGDPLVASALLTAPSFISGVTESEAAMLRSKMEKVGLSPEVLEARDATQKALADTERSWRQAMNMISERGGLKKLEPVQAA